MFFYIFSIFYHKIVTGSKEGSYKGGLIASTPHHKHKQMKPQQKCGLGTWYAASGTQETSKDITYDDLRLTLTFLRQEKKIIQILLYGKCLNITLYENFRFCPKIGIFNHPNEYMTIYENKKSEYFFDL